MYKLKILLWICAHITSYKAIGLSHQRPFLETPFTSHLRDLEKKRGVPSSQNSDGSQSFKHEPQEHSIPSNGTSPHLLHSWSEYAQYPAYSSQPGYYDPHQELHSTSTHLPTVLPEVPSQHEYINTSLTSPLISPTPMYNSPKPELEAIMSSNSRYSDNSYCPNNWGPPNPTYTQNYNYSSPSCNQQYPPVVAIYPHLYSTVNQNQIHVHVHGSSENLDKFFTSPEPSSGTTPRSTELPSVASIEVLQPITDTLQESEREQPNDPSNVWRPY